MQIDEGRRIKVLFKNGIGLEGIVEEWNEDAVSLFATACRLRSVDGDSILLIRNVDEIVAIKIVLTPEEMVDNNCPEEQENTEDLEGEKKQLELDFEQVYDQEGELDVRKLAELRQEMTKTEKQIIANKLRQHYIAEPRGVQYGSPEFFKKQSAE